MASSAMASMESIMILPGQSNLPRFVSGVPDDYKCPLCHNILIRGATPVSTECGHRFCSTCMDNYKRQYKSAESVPCPVGESDCSTLTKIYPDFSVKREIQLLEVFCTNKENGCREQMAWGQLARHLRECEHELVKCVYMERGCTEKLSAGKLGQHQQSCDYRPRHCPHCNDTLPWCQLSQHVDTICLKAPIACKFDCGTTVLREALVDHKAVCPNAPRPCTFHGCSFKGTSSALEQHLAQESVLHLTLVNTSNEKNTHDIHQVKQAVATMSLHAVAPDKSNHRITESEIQPKIDNLQGKLKHVSDVNVKIQDELEKHTTEMQQDLQQLRLLLEEQKTLNESVVQENAELKNQVHLLRGDLTSVQSENRSLSQITRENTRKIDNHLANPMEHISDGVLLWKISNYSKLKEDAVIGSRTFLYSTPFYTNRVGYKMCARLYPNGDGMGKGSHASLFFALMKGEYDQLLEWPFNKKIMFTLMDQSEPGKSHRDGFISDPKSTSFQKPTGDMNIATGCPLFIRQTELESSRYLKEDTIFIKIEVLDPS